MSITPDRVLLVALLLAAPGCRAISRFGDSRQSIAARRLSGQGFEAMHDGQWDIAENLFSNALQQSQSDDRAHWGLAESYWKRDERDLAIEHMEHAVRLSAGDPRFVQRLGRMYLTLGRLEEADRHSLWALESKRDSAEAWALRGDCLKARGEADEALAAYHRALALQPDFPDVQIEAAEIYRLQGRHDRLLATLDRLQESMGADQTPSRVDLLQGVAMRKVGRADEAQRLFLRAARKDPDDYSAHLELASLSLESGDIESARTSFAEAVRLNPSLANARDWMQQLRSEPGRLAADPRIDELPQIR